MYEFQVADPWLSYCILIVQLATLPAMQVCSLCVW